ncbi:MAG: CXXX repeat peptide maturase [Treponema sp.]|nr:CXXX repeat peptide maturase [Candidatus Treponema equifaecale]
MIESINVLLSDDSVQFCHYTTEKKNAAKWLSIKDLKECFEYSKANKININVVFPESPIPQDIKSVLENEDYCSIQHYSEHNIADVNVLYANDIEHSTFNNSEEFVFIILIEKKDVAKYPVILKQMQKKFKKLSFIITDIEFWTEKDLINYENVLNTCFDLLVSIYKDTKEKLPEINFVTDRWFLVQENSCNAGIRHYTLAPDGNIYLCPAFYFANKQDIGNIGNVKILNEHLLKYDYAPICKECDAYHCNRCVFQNKISTNELNIPSYQQCVISHLERELSRKLLCKLKLLNPLFNQIIDFKENNYTDPLVKKIQKQHSF